MISNFPPLLEIDKKIKNIKSKSFVEKKCYILRNITIETIEPYIKYLLIDQKIKLRVFYGNFDNILQDSLDENKIIKKIDPDIIIVFLWLPFFSNIYDFFTFQKSRNINSEIKRTKRYIKNTIQNIRTISSAKVIWCGVENNNFLTINAIDNNFKKKVYNLSYEINNYLEKQLNKTKNTYYLNLDKCLVNVGYNNFYDNRNLYHIKSPFSENALKAISFEIANIFRNIENKIIKCLILDCDNILWGGILGEDGLENVEIQNSPFYIFQQVIKKLYKNGVILAICSKNNKQDVLELFTKRKDMILQKNYFTQMEINWDNKAKNITKIVECLNISMDSVLFVDDSEFEINSVKAQLPEVLTLHLPISDKENNHIKIINTGFFNYNKATKEDKNRSRMYSEESLRKKILKQSKNFNDYLKSLNMKITFNKVNKKNLDRIEQLCNRTNQFNFSAKRYDKKKLNELKKSQNHHLYIANLKDNFGDYGLISFAIVEIINNDSYIDTFLMSCRALGKKVENAFLSFIYDDIKSKGINNLFSIYFKNKKNKVAYDFIINNRFSLISKNKNKYIHKINKMNKKNNYFKIKNNIKN